MRAREQKLQEQRQHQEERLKRALERAQSDPKRTVSNSIQYTISLSIYRVVED